MLERGRFRGALLGLAVGDSEPDGRWGADTSLALCLAESLLACRGVDERDQLERYLRWYRRGYWSSRGYCFGIDEAKREALEQFEHTADVQALPGLEWLVAPTVMAHAGNREVALRVSSSRELAARFFDLLLGIGQLDEERFSARSASEGQMAGARFGIRGIPVELREKCYRAAEIIGIADQLYELAMTD